MTLFFEIANSRSSVAICVILSDKGNGEKAKWGLPSTPITAQLSRWWDRPRAWSSSAYDETLQRVRRPKWCGMVGGSCMVEV